VRTPWNGVVRSFARSRLRVSPPFCAVPTAKLVFRKGPGSGAGRVMTGVCSDRPDPRWRLWITHLTPDTERGRSVSAQPLRSSTLQKWRVSAARTRQFWMLDGAGWAGPRRVSGVVGGARVGRFVAQETGSTARGDRSRGVTDRPRAAVR